MYFHIHECRRNRFFSVKAKGVLIITIGFMALGTMAELLLLGHYEDQWQLIPVILIGLSLVLFLAMLTQYSRRLLLSFKVLMTACALSGFLGVWFHLKANYEFEMELHPSASTWSLLTESLAGALPALAPGSMIVFGLIGYIYSILTIKQQQ